MAISEEQEKEAAEAVIGSLEAIVSRSLKNWARLSWYRTIVLRGLPTGIEAASEAFSSYQALIAPKQENPATVPPRLSYEWWLREAGRHMSAMDEPKALSFLEATSIVFAHSILDGSVTDLCKLAMSALPKKTAGLLAEKPFPLGRIEKAAYLDLLGEAIRAKEQEVEGFSLLKRINFLLTHYCPRKPDVSKDLPGFTLDLGRVESFDQRRHDIVHKELPDTSGNGNEELQFIQSTDIYLYLRFKENFFDPVPKPPHSPEVGALDQPGEP